MVQLSWQCPQHVLDMSSCPVHFLYFDLTSHLSGHGAKKAPESHVQPAVPRLSHE